MNILMVGTALDTNGQKQRFVEAARRWGADPSVTSALIAGEADLAGVAGRYAMAADKLGGLVIRSAHRAAAYFEFPGDIRWNRSTQPEVQRLADEADLIHLTNDTTAYFRLGQAKRRKPAVLHHHGTLFRNYPERTQPQARRFGMIQAVSTIDLKRRAPELLHWLPTAYDLDELAEIARLNRRAPDGMIRVVSAPTNREIKSTAALELAVAQLRAEGLPVELVLVEGRTWAECLAVKASADIYFDQVKLGYGCNAIEAWGMDVPVIAGADEWTLAAMRAEWNLKRKPLPFHVATEDTIADAIRELAASADLRAEVAARGRSFAETYHAERPALARLAELYALAIAKNRSMPAEAFEEFPLAPGVFRSGFKARLRVPIGNQQIQFVDGEVRIDDPKMAQKMRRIASFRRRFQITEVVEEAVA